jgi:hydrogenase maturation protease
MIVIGVGSTIRGDDGVGPAVARILCEGRPDCEFVPFDGTGLDLLGLFAADRHHDRVVVVDSLDSGLIEVGAVARIDAAVGSGADTSGYASSHHVGVLDAFRIARRLGVQTPEDLRIYAIGIRKACGFSEGLGPEIAARLGDIVEEIRRDLMLL